MSAKTANASAQTPEEKKAFYKEYIYPVVILVAIAVVTTALLAVTNFISAPVIVRNQEATANAVRQELLPDADSFTQVETDLLTNDDSSAHVDSVYQADNGSGYVITIVTKSFGGDLTMMVGLNSDGTISGVQVTNSSDTPGVGSKDAQPEYLAQYDGLSSLTSEDVKSESSTTSSGATFQYISGASVSGSAIHKGVYLALEQFAQLGS